MLLYENFSYSIIWMLVISILNFISHNMLTLVAGWKSMKPTEHTITETDASLKKSVLVWCIQDEQYICLWAVGTGLVFWGARSSGLWMQMTIDYMPHGVSIQNHIHPLSSNIIHSSTLQMTTDDKISKFIVTYCFINLIHKAMHAWKFWNHLCVKCSWLQLFIILYNIIIIDYIALKSNHVTSRHIFITLHYIHIKYANNQIWPGTLAKFHSCFHYFAKNKQKNNNSVPEHNFFQNQIPSGSHESVCKLSQI